MKKIWQLFILIFATLFFVTIAFWWECDDLKKMAEQDEKSYINCKENQYNDCMDDYSQNPAYESDCQNEAKKACKTYYYDWEVSDYQWSECLQIEPKINNAKGSCPDIAGKINRYSYSYLNESDCCFNNHYTQPYCWETNNNSWWNNTWWNNTWGNNTWGNNTWWNNTWWNNTWWNNTWANNTWGNNTWWNNTWWNNTWGNNTWANNTWWNNTWWNNTGSQQWYANPTCNANLPIQSSNNWCTTYNPNGTWYCNNWNWIDLYTQNHPWTVFNQQDQINAAIQYMNFYNSGKSDSERIWTPSFNSPWWIWNLQKLLWVSADCKLWNNTIDKFFQTDFCSKIDSNWTTFPLNWWACPEWKEIEWSCCKPSSCAKLLSWWSCDVYGSGYKPEWNCCVFDCSEWKDCPDWEKRSTWTCKCVCDPTQWCCGVQLNMVVPFIWDCIELSNNTNASYSGGKTTINQLNAFPVLMKWLSKIVVTIIMIFSIIVVVIAWLLMTTSVANESNYKKWLEMLRNVAIALILLWTSWLILRLINPTFFGG